MPASKAIFKTIVKIVANPHFWFIAIILGTLFFFQYNFLWEIGNMPFIIRHISLFAYSNDLYRATFIVPVIYAGYVFRISGALVVTLVVAMMLLARPLIETYHIGIERNAIFAFAAFFVGLSIALAENRRQREKAAFRELEENRQAYLSHLLVVQEKERLRIALDIHDDAVQTSLGVANLAQSLIDNNLHILSSGDKSKAEQIRDLSMSMCERLKQMCRDLRPSTLDHLGLIPAIQYIVSEINKGKTINVILEVKGTETRLPSEVEVNVFRIVQETLNNIKRHSKATLIQIVIEFIPARLKISVSDNGEGINLPDKLEKLAVYNKLGLLGMYERARLIGASLSIISETGQGTRVLLERMNIPDQNPKLIFVKDVIKTEINTYPQNQKSFHIG